MQTCIIYSWQSQEIHLFHIYNKTSAVAMVPVICPVQEYNLPKVNSHSLLPTSV